MFVRAAPWLLGAMIGALIGLVAWGFKRTRDSHIASGKRGRDDVLADFMILAFVALATFLIYLLLIFSGR